MIIKKYIKTRNFYVPDLKRYVSLKEMKDLIVNNKDIRFVDCSESEVLLSVLKFNEKSDDKELLNRVIDNGGFCEYIKKLEAGIQP
jgi:polyhydroxyalkanoate synthesis regulator protein